MQSVVGYPNDEAYRHDPRGAAGDRPGYGFFEVIGSTWPARLIAYTGTPFPTARHPTTLPYGTTSSAATTPPASSWPRA
jgi:hypothetical protein